MDNVGRRPLMTMISLIAGIVLLVVSIIEIIEEFDQAGVEIQHGVAIFALVHILKTCVEMVEGHRMVRESSETRAR